VGSICIFGGAALSKAICWSVHFDDGPVSNRRWQLKMVIKIMCLLVCTYVDQVTIKPLASMYVRYTSVRYFLLVAVESARVHRP
jgi:hypothetical protein